MGFSKHREGGCLRTRLIPMFGLMVSHFCSISNFLSFCSHSQQAFQVIADLRFCKCLLSSSVFRETNQLQVHGSDLLNMFGVGELGEYLIRFATNLNPNSNFIFAGLQWPKYDLKSRKVITFFDFLPRVAISQDDYRQDAMRHLTEVTLANPI